MRGVFKQQVLAFALLVSGPAQATNGYFLPGFGVKSLGAGGVGIALQADALSLAANPANAAHTGFRGDLGLSLFNPIRKSSTGPATGLLSTDDDGDGLNDQNGLPTTGGLGFDGASKSGNPLYLLPDMAFTLPVSEKLSVGFAVVGAGLATVYKQNVFSRGPIPPTENGGPDDSVGVELIQLIVPVTAAYKLTEQHSVGASLNLAAQRFKANGLGQFVRFRTSIDNAHLTNQGYDYSYGAGVRLGWLSKFMQDRVSIGATWSSRTYMTKFDKYRGLFAEQGDFDIPENYGIGLTIKATEKLTAAFDVVKIKYSDINSVGNPGPGTYNGSGISEATLTGVGGVFGAQTSPLELGNNDGLGFGWRDMTVYKLGFIYDATDDLTLRAGYNYGKSPVRNDQLVFSALAPGIVEKHFSVGLTYQMKGDLDWEISGAYMYVPNKTQEGCAQALVDCVSFSLSEHILGVGFGVKY